MAELQPNAKPCALVVEDHDDTREMLKALVISFGYDVIAAPNAEAAYRSRAPWRVALIDLSLPTVDGYELARRLRADFSDVPRSLVAITGYADPTTRRRALAAGFDEFYVKPIFPEDLARILKVAFARIAFER